MDDTYTMAVLQAGWIFVGRLERHKDFSYTLHHCVNMRRNTGGNGAHADLVAGAVELDPYGDVEFRDPIFLVPMPADWTPS